MSEVEEQVEEVAEEIETEETEETAAGGEEEVAETKEAEKQAGGEEELVISIGDEKSEEETEAPAWVKEVRNNNRELSKKLKEANKKIEALSVTEKSVVLGEKPTLDSCDLDPDVYARKLDEWHENKKKFDEQEEAKKAEENKQTEEWNATLQGYEEKKAVIRSKVKGFDEAEALVKETLSVDKQGIILQGAEDSAKLIAAIGSSPKKLEELASIKDPVKFIFAVAKVETQLKTTKRAATSPEKKVEGTAPLSGGTDKALEKLEAEAEETGDRSKIIAHKRNLKKKKKE